MALFRRNLMFDYKDYFPETPKFIELDAIKTGCISYATYMHPNPRFYKYYWWVFWRGSACEGHQFRSNEHRLSTKAAFDLMHVLSKKKEPHIIYNSRLPRLGPDTPFDPDSKRWPADTEWAPAYDEDTDPICKDGFK